MHSNPHPEILGNILEAEDTDMNKRAMLFAFYRVICQPMVPVVSAKTGKWVLPEALSPMMKPGGHGAIWKLMLDRGVFSWLSSLDCEAALVRQIRSAARCLQVL